MSFTPCRHTKVSDPVFVQGITIQIQNLGIPWYFPRESLLRRGNHEGFTRGSPRNRAWRDDLENAPNGAVKKRVPNNFVDRKLMGLIYGNVHNLGTVTLSQYEL